MSQTVDIEKTLELLRLCTINLQRDFDDISTDENKQDLIEIKELSENFLKKKGWIK